MNLSNGIETRRIKPDGSTYLVAAGAANILSDAIDTTGYEGVRIMIGFGAITSGAATSVKAQQALTTGGTYADLAGTSITVADTDDGFVAVIDILNPREAFIKIATLRATQNSSVEFIIAELYGAREVPVTQGATIIDQEIWRSVAEGTA